MAPVIRAAGPHDAEAMSRVLIASIHELCAADHGGDPAALADWTAEKTPEAIRGWLVPGHGVRVAESGGEIAAVGAWSAAGEVLLLYVAPAHRRQGISAALLAAMEAEMAGAGLAEARLVSTGTARDFYLSQGWQEEGCAVPCHRTEGFPMRKRLLQGRG